MDRDVLPEDVVIADDQATDLLRPSDMLGRPADHGMLGKLVVAPGSDPRLDHRSRRDRAVVTQFGAGLDGRKCVNGDPHAQTGFGTHCSQRMNAHKTPFAASKWCTALRPTVVAG